MKKLVPLFAALAAFLAGCASTPEETAAAQEAVVTVVQRVYGAFQTQSAPSGDSGVLGSGGGSPDSSVAPESSVSSSNPQETQGSVASAGGAAEPVLDFRYGGFKGGGAKEDSRCRISSPKITKDKISWKWETKIPSDWKRGSTSKGPMVVACAFYWNGEKWVGGKMDWCDEARTSRATDKIYGGYNGWQSAGWDAAKKRAFCVASADGKYRSNLLED
jgi:hypothetical protein